jgi:hypothetical protein
MTGARSKGRWLHFYDNDGRRRLRARRDVVFISSVLFTITLLCLVPICWGAALSGRDKMAIEALDSGYRAAAQTMGELGVASMAVIFIGLIVTWTGYVKGVRSAWFVMFIVVWLWAFPLILLPFLPDIVGIPLSELVSRALREPGTSRTSLRSVLIFTPMLIALILPIKSFFFRHETSGSSVGSAPRPATK